MKNQAHYKKPSILKDHIRTIYFAVNFLNPVNCSCLVFCGNFNDYRAFNGGRTTARPHAPRLTVGADEGLLARANISHWSDVDPRMKFLLDVFWVSPRSKPIAFKQLNF